MAEVDEELLLRQMPHSVEAEQAVIGSMLIYEKCIPGVIERVRPEDFYVRQNREIYETIYSMFAISQEIDPVTVSEQMKLQGTYVEGQTNNYLYQLMETTPTAANVDIYVDILLDKSLLRKISETADEMKALTSDESHPASEVLDAVEQKIYSIRSGKNSEGLITISEAILGVYERLQKLADNKNGLPGLSTGLPDVDNAISGLNNSDLILLAARPGMGKTSMALNILLYAGKHSGKSVVYFSLEMSREQLAMRLISNEAFLENKKLVTGRLSEEDWFKVAKAANALNHTKILIDDNPTLTVADMLAKCRRIKDLGLVVIDYLQLMQASGSKTRYASENRQQVVSDISRSLKIMAKELDVPVLCLSQLSRANESRTNKRPLLSDLRESGSIEQDADIVMFLYREDYYDENTEDRNRAECIIAKNRHGETRTVELEWMPQYTVFSSIDHMHDDEYNGE